jgi:hypothetical protein
MKSLRLGGKTSLAGKVKGSDRVNISKMFRKSAGDSRGSSADSGREDISRFGYDRFEVSEGNHIYVSSVSESSIFDDDVPIAQTEGHEEQKEISVQEEPVYAAPGISDSSFDAPIEDDHIFSGMETDSPIEAPVFFMDEEEEEPAEELYDPVIRTFAMEEAFIEEEPAEVSAEADEELDWFDDAEEVDPKAAIAGLFDNVVRGSDGCVDTDVGVFDGEEVKAFAEPAPKMEMRIMERAPEPAADDIVFESQEITESEVESAIGAAPLTLEAFADDDEVEDEVPEVFVPRIEEVEEAKFAVPETDTPMLAQARSAPAIAAPVVIPALPTASSIIALPAASAVAVAEAAVEYTEEAMAAFGEFMAMKPVKAPVIAKEMEYTAEGLEALGAFSAMEPISIPAPVREVEYSEAGIEALGEFMAMRPVAIPAEAKEPEYTAEGLEAFGEFMAMKPIYVPAPVRIREPEYSEQAMESFGAFIGMIPKEAPLKVKAPEYSEQAMEAFGAFVRMIPKEAPLKNRNNDYTAEGMEAFGAFIGRLPEARPASRQAPAWDVSDIAVEAFGDFQHSVDEELRQPFMSSLPRTISVEDLGELPAEETESFVMPMAAPQFAMTTGVEAVEQSQIEEMNKENLVIVPEKKLDNERTLSPKGFQFVDGRIQMVASEPVRIEEITKEEIDLSSVPGAASQTVTDIPAEEPVIAVPAEEVAEAPKEEPVEIPGIRIRAAKLVTKQIEGVNFSFGSTGSTNSGSVRFSF